MKKLKEDFSRNYFLSTWIANLGVVPLLLFAAFLFLPIFTFLFDLLILVTCVRDTISQLQLSDPKGLFNYSRLKVLPRVSETVKIIVLVVSLCAAPGQAKESQRIEKTTILLSIGEHKELEIGPLVKFTITNPLVIGHKFKKSKDMIIKGKKLGFTELVIWNKSQKRVFQVYVMAKGKQMKILHLAEMLKGMGISIELAGPLIIATGEVNELKDYIFLKTMEKENEQTLILKVILNKKLRNNLIYTIYKRFFDSYEDLISCSDSYLSIICHIPSQIPTNFYEDLKRRFKVDFIVHSFPSQNKNYKIQIKFFRLLKKKTNTFDKGLSQISSQISELINKNWDSLVNGNIFNLNGSDIFLQEVSNQNISTILNKKTKFSTGIEVPYTEKINNQSGETLSTKWKFSGVKFDLELIKEGKEIIMDFNASKSSQSGENQFISTSSSSTFVIPKDEVFNIFNSNINLISKDYKKLPYLSSIPLLGKLFTDETIVNAEERIVAYVKLSN